MILYLVHRPVTLFLNTNATTVLMAVNVFSNPEIEAAVAAGFVPGTSAVFIQGVIRIAPSSVGGLKPPHPTQNVQV